jgi:sulfite reductase (NADPH) flavoprotein alpha-component
LDKQSIQVLFGTESGNAEGMALIIHQLAEALGYESELIDMAQFEPTMLPKWQTVFMAISTNGEGEMPINAEACWEEAQSITNNALGHLKFAILSLGDSAYDYFCQAGIDWDNYLVSQGANAIIEREDVDADFYQPSIDWISQAFVALTGKEEDQIEAMLEKLLSQQEEQQTDSGQSYNESNPWMAKLIEKRDLCASESSKTVQHFALSLAGSDITYKPGDCIEVLAENDPALVENLMQLMFWNDSSKVNVAGKSMPLREALSYHVEIRQPTLKLLKMLGGICSSKTLKTVLETADKKAIDDILYGHDVASLIKRYSRELIPRSDITSKLKSLFGKPQYYPRFEAQLLINYLKPLQARAYSIASSQQAFNDEVHLTVAKVSYEFDERQHKGLCSHYLSDLPLNASLKCWLLPNKYFVLPEDKEQNIIMIGPGTGIAPFIGFLQSRQQQQAQGENWLFFGDRQKQYDFIYQNELQDFLDKGILTRLETAFSRDQAEKEYVQDKLKQAGKDVFAWLETGAVVYVCGDAKYMAKDVEQALVHVIGEHGSMDRGDAEHYLKDMQKHQRYLRDVY